MLGRFFVRFKIDIFKQIHQDEKLGVRWFPSYFQTTGFKRFNIIIGKNIFVLIYCYLNLLLLKADLTF